MQTVDTCKWLVLYTALKTTKQLGLKRTIPLIGLLLAWNVVLTQINTSPFPAEDMKPAFEFSVPGGFYQGPLRVELHTLPGVEIFYTTDGSEPTRRSSRYTQPIEIRQTTVLRAIAREDNKWSEERGSTYFINEPATNFAIISIAISPDRLFDPERGLFMEGSRAIDSIWSKPGANYWSRAETPIYCEIFEPDGEVIFSNRSGLRLFGGMSRLFPQKSLTLIARDEYGKDRIKHRIFGKGEEKKFKFLVLRNSGSDWGKTHFRDAFMTSLVEDWDIETQAYRPAHVYLNGMYWGIYNIREKVNKFFIADHRDVNKDSIDLIEHQKSVKNGSYIHYYRMLKFIDEHSLKAEENYRYIQTQMEVDNFMNYQIAQIYFDNQDAGGNIKFWRPRTPNGRWRWILYDTDWGFGLHDHYAYRNNSLKFHTEPNGPSWPNPPWSTFLLRKLLENKNFEQQFVNRFADYLNTTFEPQRVERKIDEFYYSLQPEIPRHLERWQLSAKQWEQQVQILHNFAQKRPYFMRQHLAQMFNVGKEVSVEVQATLGGKVVINDNITIQKEPFSGIYFEHLPITIEAQANYGYRFSHWEGLDIETNSLRLTIPLDKGDVQIKAVFEPYVHPLAGKIIINEISVNNRKSSDWIELYNTTNERIELSDWIFTDLNNKFRLPNVSIGPRDYLVICEDSAKFHNVFPQAYNIISGLPFGLSKHHERLELFAPDGAMVDSLSYTLEPMDSVFTLSLLLPTLNNSDLENWERRIGVGSPNAPNPYYVESSIRSQQAQWMQIGVASGVFLITIMLLVVKRKQERRSAPLALPAPPPLLLNAPENWEEREL